MDCMLLIIEPVGQRATRTEAQGHEAYQRMLDFGAGLAAQGRLKSAESLAPLSQAVRVSPAGVFDGPFAEAKEMVGGYFLFSCDSRDQALAIARACPAAEWATVELRFLAPCYVS